MYSSSSDGINDLAVGKNSQELAFHYKALLSLHTVHLEKQTTQIVHRPPWARAVSFADYKLELILNNY